MTKYYTIQDFVKALTAEGRKTTRQMVYRWIARGDLILIKDKVSQLFIIPEKHFKPAVDAFVLGGVGYYDVTK